MFPSLLTSKLIIMYYWKLFKRNIIGVYSTGVIKMSHTFTMYISSRQTGPFMGLSGRHIAPLSCRSHRPTSRPAWSRCSAGCCCCCSAARPWSWWSPRWSRPPRRSSPRPGSRSVQSRPRQTRWGRRARPAPAGSWRRPGPRPASGTRWWRRDSWRVRPPPSHTWRPPQCTPHHNLLLLLLLLLLHTERGWLPDSWQQDRVHWESRTVPDTDCHLKKEENLIEKYFSSCLLHGRPAQGRLQYRSALLQHLLKFRKRPRLKINKIHTLDRPEPRTLTLCEWTQLPGWTTIERMKNLSRINRIWGIKPPFFAISSNEMMSRHERLCLFSHEVGNSKLEVIQAWHSDPVQWVKYSL